MDNRISQNRKAFTVIKRRLLYNYNYSYNYTVGANLISSDCTDAMIDIGLGHEKVGTVV